MPTELCYVGAENATFGTWLPNQTKQKKCLAYKPASPRGLFWGGVRPVACAAPNDALFATIRHKAPALSPPLPCLCC